jgi:hypothetical protein
MDRLRALQPNPAYMRLFNAIVRDVWKAQEADARKAREQAKAALVDVERREHLLNSTFIYERRIDEKTYAAQRDKLREEATLLEIQTHESRLEELDLEALLVFAEQVLTDAARMWSEASLEQRTRLQAVFFPKGLVFDGERFGTAATCLAFSELHRIPAAENGVASQGLRHPADVVERQAAPLHVVCPIELQDALAAEVRLQFAVFAARHEEHGALATRDAREGSRRAA